MTPEQMKDRTKKFGLRILKLVDALPRRVSGRRIGDQLLRSGTSVGANYRAACRSRSSADFIAKLGIVEEEADEAAYWLEVLCESGLMPSRRLEPLMKEAEELLSIVVASINTSRGQPRSGKDRGNGKSAIRNPRSAINT